MGTRERKPTAATTGEEPAVHEGAERPERWRVQRKTELVLRLLRGEALDAVSRENQIPAHDLASWVVMPSAILRRPLSSAWRIHRLHSTQ